MESVLRWPPRRAAHRRGRRASCARCAARCARAPASAAWPSARRARTRSRCGRTSGSSRGPATATSSARCASSPARRSSSGSTSTSALDDPDKAIHVANGMRVHVPVLLALSANSPFWRADATGLASVRTPIFRAFPRVGIPPTYGDWADYERRIEFMSGVRGDRGLHLPLVRRASPPQLRHGRGPGDGRPDAREHTLPWLRWSRPLVKELAEHFERRQPLSELPARDARREQVAGRPPRSRRRAGRPARAERVAHPSAGRAPGGSHARARPGPGLRARAGGH